MSFPSQSNTQTARTTYAIKSGDIVKILSHRIRNNSEEYLVRWKSVPSERHTAVCSWHSVPELRRCLHLVQKYIHNVSHDCASASSKAILSATISRKRKSPEADAPVYSAATLGGLLTPALTSSETSEAGIFVDTGPLIYNGIFERKEGRLIAKRLQRPDIVSIDALSLPTKAMIEAAATAPINAAERAIRDAFIAKLAPVKGVSLQNTVDSTTPALDFTFINSYVLRDGVKPLDEETRVGCQQCRPNMGQNIGCEYPQKCECLEFAAVDEQKLKHKDPARYAQWLEDCNPSGLPKRFPYTRPHTDNPSHPSVLLSYYREQRHPIYECNEKCKCGPRCKSRLVQKGRRVPLTIFKTETRGWGVYCNEDLVQGEFIDTYLGEVITNAEAELREQKSGIDKNSYLYSLDKFVEDGVLTADECFVVDGQHMGGPTRFINHSCEPNCRQYTVSYNKNDLRIFDLAFFAYENIPRGTELTFDYMDKDEEEEDEAIRKREAATNDPRNDGKVQCNCGARKCRGFLWV